MLSKVLHERVDALIDDLILDGGIEAAALASILMASKDSLNGEYVVGLSRRVWAASDDLKTGYALAQVGWETPEVDPADEDGASTRSLCRTG